MAEPARRLRIHLPWASRRRNPNGRPWRHPLPPSPSPHGPWLRPFRRHPFRLAARAVSRSHGLAHAPSRHPRSPAGLPKLATASAAEGLPPLPGGRAGCAIGRGRPARRVMGTHSVVGSLPCISLLTRGSRPDSPGLRLPIGSRSDPSFVPTDWHTRATRLATHRHAKRSRSGSRSRFRLIVVLRVTVLPLRVTRGRCA